MPGGIGRLLVAEDERVARLEPLPRERHPAAEVDDGVVRLPRVHRLEAERDPEPAQECRVRREDTGDAVALEEARHPPRPAEPLERDHVEALAFEAPHHLARPRLAGARGALSLRHERLRTQQRVPGPEERIRVGDPLVGAAGDPQHRFAPPDVRQRKGQPVELDPVAAGDELLGQLGVTLRVGPADEPPAVIAPLRRPQRRVGEDVLRAHVLSAPKRLEDCASWKLVGSVAQHRPVRDLGGRRPPRADRIEQAGRAARRQRIEVRRLRGLVPGPPAEHLVRPVGEPVEQEDDDRIHGAEANPRRVSGRELPGRLDDDRAAEAVEVAGADLVQRHEDANRVAVPARELEQEALRRPAS